MNVFSLGQLKRCESCNQRLELRPYVAEEDMKLSKTMHEADRI